MIEGIEGEVGRGIEEEDLEVEALQGLEVDQAPEERVEEEEVTIEEEDLPGLQRPVSTGTAGSAPPGRR